MDLETVSWPWVALIAGVTARMVLPFLVERRDNPDLPWRWRYIWPQLVGVVVAVLLLPVIVPDLAGVAALPAQAAFIAGWGAADLGRELDKLLLPARQP